MRKIVGKVFILVVVFFSNCLLTLADPPGPPDPGGPPGGGGVPVGGGPLGGPVGDGLIMLLVLSVTYAAWKVYSIRKEHAKLIS
jgi:hypothetical protein